MITKSLVLTGIAGGGSDAAVVAPPTGGLVQNGTDIFGNPVAAQIFVQGPGITVTVSGLAVDGTGNNIPGCGPPALEGIYFQNSSGTITRNAVRNQYQTDFAAYGGCQNGLAINVESPNAGNIVTISANSVRAYQKNGITATGAATGAGSPGPAVAISGNHIVGLAATPMNWPTCPDYQVCAGNPPEVNGGAAENGIQVGFGASGTVSKNIVDDNIWWGEYPQFNYAGLGGTMPGNGASGILVFASNGIAITSNTVGSAQFGIATDSDLSSTYCNGGPCGPADYATITSNTVNGTQVFDGIDVCSYDATVKGNTIYGSAESGIHLDDTCGSGNYNTVTGNTINEACAGILLGTAYNAPPSGSVFSNVTYTTLAGDVCTPLADLKAGKKPARHRSLGPSPYVPNRNVWSAALSQAKNDSDRLVCANVFGLCWSTSSWP